MITTAAPAWLRRSDRAVTWARHMLHRDRAVVIDCETTDLPGDVTGPTVLVRSRPVSDGKPGPVPVLLLLHYRAVGGGGGRR